MGMVVRTNTMALNAYRQLGMNNSAVSKSLEKLSSGFRINRAGDDAAGLAISEKMKAQIKGLETASSNAQDGISLIQTAEGNLNEVHSMLNRMVELATKSANGTYQNEVDREAIQAEVDSLLEEIDRISESANFNGIKLLNGGLAKNVTTSRFAEIETGTDSSVSGINMNPGTNGAGAKSTYEIDLAGSLFGTGDTITFNGTTNGTGSPNAIITFAFGTDIKGETAEEQAQSLAEKMKGNATIGTNFDIKVDGTKISITANKEGTDQATIDTIDVADKKVELKAPTFTASATAAGTTKGAGWDSILGSATNGTGTGYNVEVGDTIEFNFLDSAGVTITAKVTITQDMVKNNPTVAELTDKIVETLKKTTFEDNEDTAIDESRIKVEDLFNLTANQDSTGATANGGICVGVNSLGNGTMTAGNVVIKNASGKEITPTGGITASSTTSGTAATTAAKAVVATSTDNFSKGDVFTIKGKLSDGRDFTATLVAGEDFEVDSNGYESSLGNIIDALSSGTGLNSKAIKVEVEGEKIDSDLIFGSGTGADFSLTQTGGALTIESKRKGLGKGVSGTITSVEAKAVSSVSNVELKTVQVAEDPGHAASSIKFDNKSIDYGAAVKIGDQVFEVVADSRDVTSRDNVAVVIDDLKNASSADIAKAFMDAATEEDLFVDKADVVLTTDKSKFDDTPDTGAVAKALADGSKYAVSVKGGELTIETLEKGSSVAAPELSSVYGDKVDYLTVKFDPSKTKYGDSFNVDGKTYEFVAKDGDAKEGNIAIVVPDMAKATSKDLGDAFVAVAKGVTTHIEDDGTVKLTSQADANGMKGKVSLTFEGQGLTLQIGDTSDDFNKVSVFVENMSSKGLGVDGLNVLTQESAGDAIDVIRNAINKVSTARANMGALQNRLEYTINNLDVAAENMSAANSRIRDTDMAKEMMNYTKMNVLVQSAQAMLAQANQQPQSVLQLLQ